MSERPTAAFVLSLISGVLVLLTALIIFVVASLLGLTIGEIGEFPEIPGLSELFAMASALFVVMGVLGLIFGALILVGAVMIYSGKPGKVKTGSILVLVFSILSLITVGGGFVIGFILGLIGSILGLTWKPPVKQEPSASGLPQS